MLRCGTLFGMIQCLVHSANQSALPGATTLASITSSPCPALQKSAIRECSGAPTTSVWLLGRCVQPLQGGLLATCGFNQHVRKIMRQGSRACLPQSALAGLAAPTCAWKWPGTAPRTPTCNCCLGLKMKQTNSRSWQPLPLIPNTVSPCMQNVGLS